MIPLGILASARVAPASGALPGSFPTGLDLWAKADAITGATSGSVLPSGTWVDSSGNGRDLSSAAAPTYVSAAGKGGLPVVRFSGAGKFLASTAPAGGAEQTIAAALKLTNTGGYQGLRCSNGNGGLYCRFEPASKPEMVKNAVAAMATATGTTGFAAWHVVVWTFSDSGNAYTMEVDGVNVGSGTTALSLVAAPTLLGKYSGDSEYLTADVGEFASWSVVLSPTDRASLASGLAAKWI